MAAVEAVELYPEIEPYDAGWLDVGDGQAIYWEASGNPDGTPAVALHGGPGSGLRPRRRQFFDPERYRLIQFDQRGAGRSTPPVSDPRTPMTHNTPHHLIRDIEVLRVAFGVERWVVWGGSWGVTLALAYAQRHPERVRAMVLVSVTATRRVDVAWLYHGAGRYFPAEWARFRAGVPTAERDGDLVAAYNRLLNEQPDDALRAQAAADWCAWEDAVVSLEEGWEPNPRYADPGFRMTFARTCAHYFSHGAWLEEGELIANADRLTGIPGVLIQGRFDLAGPPDVGWLLAQRWPDAELHLVRTGHTGGDPMTAVMLPALDRFAR
jgi:proline iminopeptidase